MIEQIGIALFGVSAVFLSQDARESWRRWACICGLIGQPFWFYATWQAEQWGIFALCFVYFYSWARGIRTYWLPKRPPRCERDTHNVDWSMPASLTGRRAP